MLISTEKASQQRPGSWQDAVFEYQDAAVEVKVRREFLNIQDLKFQDLVNCLSVRPSRVELINI